MDKSLQLLCATLKKIIWQLKPKHNALSFVILTGKTGQGKTTLLRQSQFEHITIEAERSSEIYFNAEGIIVEIGEAWLTQSKNILQHTLKQLNRCHRTLKINGIILCIDINELLISEPLQTTEQTKAHAQLLRRFGQSLHYQVDATILFTKLDALAGFCEFFQYEHTSNLNKPLGFSLHPGTHSNKLKNTFKIQFDQLIDSLEQQVISKMHPARSSLKRTLIREFPLQLASLRLAIQALIQNISPHLFRLQALYFTSAEQGGVSLDCLNKKIHHEYALTVQDKFPQANNYRAYFITGALSAFQMQTKKQAPLSLLLSHKWLIALLAGTAGLVLLWLGSHHLKAARRLDETSKELLMYESLLGQKNNTPALYHLTQATTSLNKINANIITLPTITDLQTRLHIKTQHHLQASFLPNMLAEIEHAMTDPGQSPLSRYQALKIYLTLSETQRFSQEEALAWFAQYWQKNSVKNITQKLALLKQILHQPLQKITINQQIVRDVRNYINALPASYLYYTLAKNNFPLAKRAISVQGFDLASKEIPIYFTKTGFYQMIKKLPEIGNQLKTENWVLSRPDPDDLTALLQQAYCFEYVAWWQNFMSHSRPQHFQDYQQAHALIQNLYQTNAIGKLVTLIQQETSPELSRSSPLFNQEIASKFTSLNLLSRSAIRNVTFNMNELEKFVSTLALVKDQGRTAFALTKARFLGDSFSNPLNALYARTQQLPEPLSLWVKQIADDVSFLLINESRTFINQQWQQTVFQTYHHKIANRYPFDPRATEEVTFIDFEHFFSPNGELNDFFVTYLKPFLDTSQPQWQLKEANGYVLPLSSDLINELIRANVITNMFFANKNPTSKIEFSLQKLSLDPIVGSLRLVMGTTKLYDDQNTDSFTTFTWPASGAKLTLNSIEGSHYEIEEKGLWAFFKLLQKVNVLVDEHDSSSLQILFEINGNSGRYLLKTQSQVNPFIPGILNGFTLTEVIV